MTPCLRPDRAALYVLPRVVRGGPDRALRPPRRRLLERLMSALSVLTLVAALQPAQAADPVRGAQLYANSPGGNRQSCASCHGSSPLTSNGSKIYVGRNSSGLIQSAVNNNTGGMAFFNSYYSTAEYADIAAYLGNSPSTLAFASTPVGGSSAVQTVTVKASTSAALSALSVATSGDFARSGGTCGASLSRGLSCTVGVVFSPSAAGSRSGTLSIAHSGIATPVAIALTGSAAGAATAPLASLSAAALTFASTAVGASSAAQTVTLSNTGNAALTLGSITTGSSEFPVAGGTCVAGASVAAGGSCSVSLGFQPAATGARTATLSIAHNAAGGASTVALSGTATAAAAPQASLSVSSLNFGSIAVGQTSSAQTVTLTNTGNATMVLGSLQDASGEFPTIGGSCNAGGTVAAGGSCTVGIGFRPGATGTRTATLSLASNAGNSPVTVTLTGSGVAATPVTSASPGALSFTQTVGSRSALQTVTLSNTGTAALSLGAIALGGSQAAEFDIDGGSSCTSGASVAAGASCSLLIGFTPSAAGARSATLSLAHNASASPTVIALNGTGTASAVGTVSLDASALAFGANVVGMAASSRTLLVSNSGSAALSLSSLAVSGTAAGDYSLGGTCSAGAVLAAGGSCSLIVGFTPSAIGERSATLLIASTASNGSAAVGLSGSGAAAPAPAVSLSPAAVDFGSVGVGSAASARSVVLTNSGSGVLSLGAIATGSPFSVGHNCGSSLAPAAHCTLQIGFSPSAAGSAAGAVSIASNAAGSPHTLALSGTGAAAAPSLSWVPASANVGFGSVSVGGAAATVTLTLANAGPGSVTLQAPSLSGSQASDFALAAGNGCSAGTVLPAGGSCQLVIGFSPSAAGARSATLAMPSDGSSPGTLALSGTGVAVAAAAVNLSASALNFSASGDNGAQTLTLGNSGASVLAVTSVAVGSGAYSVNPAANNGCNAAPFSLQPGQSCALSVIWNGGDTGTGTLELSTSASAAPMTVALSASIATTRGDDDADGPDDHGADHDSDADGGESGSSGGGCTVAPNAAADPLFPLLLGAAIGVLWWRRRTARPIPMGSGAAVANPHQE